MILKAIGNQIYDEKGNLVAETWNVNTVQLAYDLADRFNQQASLISLIERLAYKWPDFVNQVEVSRWQLDAKEILKEVKGNLL